MEKELLPENDREFLEEKGLAFELIPFNAGIYLIIRNFEFPEYYTPKIADLLVILPAGYPNAPVDMFFTIPYVKLHNGNWPDRAASHPVHNGIQWQQWSRHINWRIGIDNLRTFFAAIKKELAKGI